MKPDSLIILLQPKMLGKEGGIKMGLGEHKVKPLPFAYGALKGISEQVNKWHHDTHYAGYVNKRNEIEIGLEKTDKSKANANYSEFGEMKRREAFNAAGQILHEMYWNTLGGNGIAEESLAIAKKIKSDFGSFEKWKEDFIASTKISLGWTVLCLDRSDGKLHNFVADSHNQGIWGTVPLLAIDTFEHAYYFDNGPNRAQYIEAFLKNVDWKKVNMEYEKAAKN